MSSEQPTHHGWAVNVKDHGYYNVERGLLTEHDVERLYQRQVEDFWNLAETVAQEHGFRDVYGEGRMGGWAVPQPQVETDDMEEDELADWIEFRFRPFERDLLALMEDMRHDFLEALADAVERANAEPAEAAYWAARDVITVETAPSKLVQSGDWG